MNNQEVLEEPNLARSELNGLETYFKHWLTDFKITEENIVDQTGYVYEVVSLPRWWEAEFQELYSTPNMKIHQSATAPLIEAFFNVQVGRRELALRNMLRAETWLQETLENRTNEVLSPAHVSGFQYLSQLLEAECGLRAGATTDGQLKRIRSGRTDYDGLGDKGKSIIQAARWILNQTIRKEKGAKDLERVRDLDPQNWVWNELLYSRLRIPRLSSQVWERYLEPSSLELEASLNAVEFSNGSVYHETCISGLCQSLAEIVRYRIETLKRGRPVSIRTHVLETTDAILEYIREQSGKALSKEAEMHSGELSRYGDIFFTILPETYRDPDLAEACYIQYLGQVPDNSRANHKMGQLQLFVKKDVTAAEKYFRNSMTLHPCNFPAMNDLIRTLLGSVVENSEEIERCFADVWDREKNWKPNQASTFHFLHGCFYFLKGNVDAAFGHWIQTDEALDIVDRKHYGFKNLQFMQKVHLWLPSNVLPLTLEIIQMEIRRRLHRSTELEALYKCVSGLILLPWHRAPRQQLPLVSSRNMSGSAEQERSWRSGGSRSYIGGGLEFHSVPRNGADSRDSNRAGTSRRGRGRGSTSPWNRPSSPDSWR